MEADAKKRMQDVSLTVSFFHLVFLVYCVDILIDSAVRWVHSQQSMEERRRIAAEQRRKAAEEEEIRQQRLHTVSLAMVYLFPG